MVDSTIYLRKIGGISVFYHYKVIALYVNSVKKLNISNKITISHSLNDLIPDLIPYSKTTKKLLINGFFFFNWKGHHRFEDITV